MDSKKKTAILVALFVVIIAVGAFQFSGMADGSPAPKAQAKDKKAKDKGASTTEEKPAAKNPAVSADLAQRDPFHQEDLLPPPTPTPQQPVQQPRRVRNLPNMPELPPAQIDKTGLAGLGVTPERQQGYAVSVVILGSRPAAVFVDAQGGERLVPLGGALDGDTQVVGIEKGAVSVRFRGKTLRIPTGGNGSGK